MLRMLIACIGFFCVVSLQAQEDPFEYTWGNAGLSEGGADVLQLPSGSIFYCGFSEVAPNQIRVNVTRFSADGQIEESWLFGAEGKNIPGQMRWIDNKLVIAGQTEFANGNIDGFWLQLDTLGNQTHWSTFGLPSRTEIFLSFDADANGDLVVCGVAGADNGLWNNAMIVKFNAQFMPQWIDVSTYPDNNLALSLAVIDDTNYVITGDRRIDQAYYNLYVRRYSNSGDVLWDYFEPNGFNGGSKAIMVNSNNEIIVVGESSGEGFDPFEPTFTRISATGDLILETYFPSSPFSDAAFSVIEPIPGSYLISGYGYNDLTSSVDATVIYSDENGVEVNRKFYHLSAGNDVAFSISLAAEQGFLLAGRSGNFDEGNFIVFDIIPLVLSVSEQNEFNTWNCYPNPVIAGGEIRTDEKWFRAEIFSIDGKLVRRVSNNENFTMPDAGVYVIRFYDSSSAILASSRIVVLGR